MSLAVVSWLAMCSWGGVAEVLVVVIVVSAVGSVGSAVVVDGVVSGRPLGFILIYLLTC
jgi:hypothetical protein